VDFGSIEDVLDFAIREEAEAAAFYRRLAAEMERPEMRRALEGFAREEEGHRAKLEAIKSGDVPLLSPGKDVRDLGIADHLVDVEIAPEMDYQQALAVAMQKEKNAFRLYSRLAEASENEEIRKAFRALAQEEAGHKLRFEIEYDDGVLNQAY
jgi:rubrerythrin